VGSWVLAAEGSPSSSCVARSAARPNGNQSPAIRKYPRDRSEPVNRAGDFQVVLSSAGQKGLWKYMSRSMNDIRSRAATQDTSTFRAGSFDLANAPPVPTIPANLRQPLEDEPLHPPKPRFLKEKTSTGCPGPWRTSSLSSQCQMYHSQGRPSPWRTSSLSRRPG